MLNLDDIHCTPEDEAKAREGERISAAIAFAIIAIAVVGIPSFIVWLLI